MVIGVTGYSGSGKSLVCKILNKLLNFDIISCDDIAKQISKTKKITKKINKLKNEYGDISLVTLAKNPKLLKKINKITHKVTWEKVRKISRSIDNSIIETALPSKKFFKICDFTIGIKVNDLVKINRIMERNMLSESNIKNILAMQKKYDKMYNMCDLIIENNDNVIDLERKLDEICKSRKWK